MKFVRTLVIAAVAYVPGTLATPTPAWAQAAPDVNCTMLANSPYMCVKNASHYQITHIQAYNGSTFNPSAWIALPGGWIAPGGTTVVKFPVYSGGCVQTVFVRTTGGTHSFPAVNVCSNTSFVIRDW